MFKAIYADITHSKVITELNKEMIEDSGHIPEIALLSIEQRILGWLKTGEYTVVLFLEASRYVGYALYKGVNDVYLRQFLIRMNYRRLGLGTSAFAFLWRYAWHHADRIYLDVHPSNLSAYIFWRSLGFEGNAEFMEFTDASCKIRGIDSKFKWVHVL